MSDLFNLIQFNLITLGAALLIGIAAGRWMFAGAPEQAPQDETQP